MQLRVGYELISSCRQPTPMMLMLNIHHTRASDIVVADVLTTNPSVLFTSYRDAFGNWCTRLVAPAGRISIASTGVVTTRGSPNGRRARRVSTPWRNYPMIACCSCSAAATAKPIGCQIPPGPCSRKHRRARDGCRRSVTSCITTLPSATPRRGQRRQRGKCLTRSRASAETTRTWRSRSAAA